MNRWWRKALLIAALVFAVLTVADLGFREWLAAIVDVAFAAVFCALYAAVR